MISAIVNTCNEERYIKRCLEHLRWADEIVIVDMYSTDRSVEIAREFTDKIYFHEKTISVLYARNFSLTKANGDWILVVDPDEVVPQSLAESLRNISASNPEFSAVALPMRMHFLGKRLNYAYPVIQKIRFFKKGTVSFPARVHSQPVVTGGIYILPDEERYMAEHYVADNLGRIIEKTLRYTSDEAYHKCKDGIRVSGFDVIKKPFAEAYHIIFSRKGYKDGLLGFVFAMYMFFYRFRLYEKLWILARK